MDGIIIIDKPSGDTSFSLVKKLQTLTGEKVGHAGTLDPLASGVLPICIGRATRLVDYIMAGEKEYFVDAVFGTTTDTEDRLGTTLIQKAADFTYSELESLLQKFIGDIMQTPPMYSAIKKNGKRLYELARSGIEVERDARAVKISQLELLSLKNGDHPRAKLRVVCSKGTYMRTLCKDIGDALGCGGHMAELRRTRCGKFDIKNSVPLNMIEDKADAAKYLISMDSAIDFMPRVKVPQDLIKKVLTGQTIPKNAFSDIPDSSVLALFDAFGNFIAIAQNQDNIKPIKVFSNG
ncbi:MAG: tRNA pseudouridine(55) synthase TruB [bacterium]